MEPERSLALDSPYVRSVALILLAVLAYGNSLSGPFVFDDWHVVPQNPAVHSLKNIPQFFTDPTTFSVLSGNQDYRPVFQTSMALSWWAGDGSTTPFHVTSVALHIGCVILLFFLMRRMLYRGSPGGRADPDVEWASFVAAGLLAVHPLTSESVNYISSQSVLWVAFFYLIALLAFTLYRGRLEAGRSSSAWLLLVGPLAYALALLSKPTAITLPLILITWELLLSPEAPALRSWRRVVRWGRLRYHVPYWLVTFVYLGIRRVIFETPFASADPPRERFVHYLTETKALVDYYLRLSIYPRGLNADIEYPVSTSVFDGGVLLTLAVIVFAAWAIRRLPNRRLVAFWAFWFPICLVVETYAVVLGQIVNEHRAYLPLIGICALGGVGLLGIWRSLPWRLADFELGRRSGRVVSGAVVAVILLVFVSGTRARNGVWASELTLWRDAAQNGGTWRAHMNYALALEGEEGRADEALVEFRRAVELGPYAWAHMNLGHALVRRGEYDEGLQHLRTAVNLWPTLPEAHLFLGYGLQRSGDTDKAEREMRTALQLRPNYLRAFDFLGRLYEETGRSQEATDTYLEALDVDPTLTWARERIDALMRTGARQPSEAGIDFALDEIQQGRFEDAVAILETSRQRDPDNPDVLFNLGFAYQRLGRRADAIESYVTLLEIAPDHRKGNFNLAYAYLQGTTPEDWESSIDRFVKVLDIDPDYTEVLHHLATANWKLGRREAAIRFDQFYLDVPGHAELRARSSLRIEEGAGP